jgi:hypothetical protein
VLTGDDDDAAEAEAAADAAAASSSVSAAASASDAAADASAASDTGAWTADAIDERSAARAQNFPHLSFAFTESMQQFGPNDFFVMQKCMKEDAQQPTLKAVVALLKLGDWDADVFYKVISRTRTIEASHVLQHKYIPPRFIYQNAMITYDRSRTCEAMCK